MKTLPILFVLAVVLILAFPASAEKATQDEALTLAKDWVALTLAKDGNWDGQPAAQVTGIQELKRHGRLLGYFCTVSPKGYVIVSLHKELAAVKAYSDTSDLAPASDEGMADLIKGGMERQIDWAETKLGKKLDVAQPAEIGRALEINYRKAWDYIASSAATKSLSRQSAGIESSAAPSGPSPLGATSRILLTSAWHQFDPYNQQCPAVTGCDHALVGCVATAGSQIMRYWDWPPQGYGGTPYDWRNMPDDCTTDSPQVQKDAVARLCREVGNMASMQYGCAKSGAFTTDEAPIFDYFTPYDPGAGLWTRSNFTAQSWFDLFVGQINQNRPVMYNVVDHTIVGDGWITNGNYNEYHWYHMNYGWKTKNDNTWYLVDALNLGNPDIETMVCNIVPKPWVGPSMVGTYNQYASPYSPYRYVNVSTSGTGVTFNSGHLIQFLPGMIMTGTGSSGVRVNGSGGANTTRLFTRGDTSRGIRITLGAVKVMNGGEVTLK